MENLVLCKSFLLVLVVTVYLINVVYPPYHRHLDVYATYALTLSEHSLQAVIQILNATNQKWEALTEIFTEYPPPRTIDVRAACIVYSAGTKLTSCLFCSGWTQCCLD